MHFNLTIIGIWCLVIGNYSSLHLNYNRQNHGPAVDFGNYELTQLITDLIFNIINISPLTPTSALQQLS